MKFRGIFLVTLKIDTHLSKFKGKFSSKLLDASMDFKLLLNNFFSLKKVRENGG